MRSPSILTPLALALVAPALGVSTATATTSASTSSAARAGGATTAQLGFTEQAGRTTAARARAPRIPRLVGIRAGHRNGHDRVVFRFRGPAPEVRKRYVKRLVAEGSGARVRIAGRRILQMDFDPARAHRMPEFRPTVAKRRSFALPNVTEVVRSGDFEGVVSYGIGLAKRSPVTVRTLENPTRVVVRVKADFPTLKRKVFFLDRDNFDAGVEPSFVPVQRRVPKWAAKLGTLDRLYAGPTAQERRSGLRLVRSRTRTHADLRVRKGVARVTLLGRCDSGGSTATVAGHVMPTLRQFKGVSWVKIYNRHDETQRPRGKRDSVPDCLEP